MIPLLSASEMAAFERESIHGWGMPSLLLQEHAALGALNLIPKGLTLHVLAGPGNNGGDALALARLARLRGEEVEVWTLQPDPVWSGDAATQAALWEGLGQGYRHTCEIPEAIRSFRGWVVDGLFGLGTRLPLREPAFSWARSLQAFHHSEKARRAYKVLALDLPTGLDPSSSEAGSPIIPADVTACFGFSKICHALMPARSFCGDIVRIPLPFRGHPSAALHAIEMTGPLRPGLWNSHKRDFGHVAIRAGTKGMSGAAVLAALGALGMGAGLVTVLPDPDVHAEVACQIPEAMVRPWNGVLPDGIDVLLVGPGGVTEIPSWGGLLVLDASALRPGDGPSWMNRPNTVITPHAGEFSRLFSPDFRLPRDTTARLEAVRHVATGPGIIVLKGAETLVSGGPASGIFVNLTGHPGLSTGGTGDFLSGMISGLIASRIKSSNLAVTPTTWMLDAVLQSVWLHGRAADLLGPGPILVRQLLDSLLSIHRNLISGSAEFHNIRR